MGLLLQAIAKARDSDLGLGNMLETILVRVADGPDAAEVLGAALRSPSRILRRVAALRACLVADPHNYHIAVGPEDREAFERAFRETALPLELHLMIREPERHVETFAQAGADGITVHQEVSPHLHRTLSAIRALDC